MDIRHERQYYQTQPPGSKFDVTNTLEKRRVLTWNPSGDRRLERLSCHVLTCTMGRIGLVSALPWRTHSRLREIIQQNVITGSKYHDSGLANVEGRNGLLDLDQQRD